MIAFLGGFGFFSSWNVIYQILIFATPRRCLFRGKILTWWIRKRIFRPSARSRYDTSGLLLRTVQIMVVCGGLFFVVSQLVANVLGWIWCIGLYVDDYLTGDDDKWKRFKGWVGNKVKWKMELPTPPVRETA